MSNLFPDKWKPVKFEDVVKDVRVTEKNPLENGLERFVGLEHLDSDDLKIKRWGLIKDGTSFTKKFVKGQILFGKRRVYQHKAALADFDGLCSGDILVFDVKNDQLIPELLPFIVQSDNFFDYAIETSAGSLSPRTKWKFLSEYKFPLPPIEEQKKIAEILRAVEENIEKLQLLIDSTKKCFLAMLSKVYSKKYFKKSENSKIISQIFEDSYYYNLGEIAFIKGRIGWKGLKAKEYTKTGPYLIAAKHIINSKIDWENCDHLNDFRYNESDDIKLEEKDIIISKDGTIGRVAYINNLPDKATINSTMMLIRIKNKNVIPKYVYYYFKGPQFKKLVMSKLSGSAIPHIFQKDMKKLNILIPDFIKQKKLVEYFDKFDVFKNLLLNSLSDTQKLKKQIFNDLFSGK